MEIVSADQGIIVRKPEGTNVTYYIFPEYELHYNIVEPGTVQPWHHHNVIEEVLYIISGELEAHWLADGKRESHLVHAGDVVRVEKTPHTFINSSKSAAMFIVVRLVLDGVDKRELIKSDKHVDHPK